LDRLWRRIDPGALAVTAGCLVLWRLLNQIPVTDLTHGLVMYRLQGLNPSGFLGLIGAASVPLGGYSIGAIGIGPYVEALIIFSLARAVSARLRAMRLERWTRAIGLLLCLGQSYGWTLLMQSTGTLNAGIDWSARLAVCLELTAGTALMILLADVLDERGLGFGNGAVIFYALGPLATEVHRLADYLPTLQIEGFYRPVVVWAVFTVGVTVATVGLLLASRLVPPPPETKSRRKPAPTQLRFLMSGVLRPPVFTFAVMVVPTTVANYYARTNPAAVQWFTANWSPYGSSVWLDVAYLLLEAVLIVFFAYFVVAYDWTPVQVPAHLRDNAIRLGVLGGLCLAALVVAAPVANHLLAEQAGYFGKTIPMSGADVVLVVAVILTTVRIIEGHLPIIPFTASPSRLP
jgi:preprotein translocase subunit SecY